jgi:hypothetical protein
MIRLAAVVAIGILSLQVLEAKTARADASLQTEFGYETIYRIPNNPSPSYPDEFSLNRPYLIQKLDVSFAPPDNSHSIWTQLRPDKISAEYRAWGDFSYLRSNSGQKDSINLRTLKLAWTGETWNLTVGLQDIVWGETFGERVVDLVNPRDYSDYLLTDLSWAILPVWSINLQKFLDPFSFQLVYTPLTVRDDLPDQVAGVPIVDNTQNPRAFADAEYGGRAGVLLPEGTDLKAYYYHHFNRIPVVKATALSPTQEAFSVLPPEMIDTYGASATHVLGPFVLRGDFSYNHDQLLTAVNYGSPVAGNPLHLVLGSDWTADDQSTLGLQFHYDSDPRDASPLYWASTQAKLHLLDGKLAPELLIYKGINNRDLWANPGVTVKITRNLLAHAQADWILGRQGSLFQIYQQENRLLGRLSYLF